MAKTMTLNTLATGTFIIDRANYQKANVVAQKGGAQVAEVFQKTLVLGVDHWLDEKNESHNPSIFVDSIRALSGTNGYGEKKIEQVSGWFQDHVPCYKIVNSKKGLRIVIDKDYQGEETLTSIAAKRDEVVEALTESKWFSWKPERKDPVETTLDEDIVKAIEKLAKKHDKDFSTIVAEVMRVNRERSVIDKPALKEVPADEKAA